MPHLFDEFRLRDVVLPNRIAVSPMCQYSCEDGLANEWHAVHLGSRAVGGAGLVFTEAAAVTADGRISPQDLGIWSDPHAEKLEAITRFIATQGAVPAIQLAHAGRKASTYRPWSGNGAVREADQAWQPVGPNATPFSATYPIPKALTIAEIEAIQAAFVAAARRAVAVGFRVLELHAAHGYLLHEFLSPLSNDRTDVYGGSFENRTRLLRDTAAMTRAAVPEGISLWVRISATDWVDGGWDIEQSVELARQLKVAGVDLIDCSSGGTVEGAVIPVGAGYQTPFADRIRREAGVATAAVGMITSPAQADQIIRNGHADIVLMARELLRDPYWPLHAAEALRQTVQWPAQYLRAAPHGSPERKILHKTH